MESCIYLQFFYEVLHGLQFLEEDIPWTKKHWRAAFEFECSPKGYDESEQRRAGDMYVIDSGKEMRLHSSTECSRHTALAEWTDDL